MDAVDPEVTRILNATSAGDPHAADELLPLVYTELRRLAAYRMANEQPGQTLQATALVHEAWLRLENSGANRWDNRRHFFAAASEAMRRILVDNARRKKAARHGGGQRRAEHKHTWSTMANLALAYSKQGRGAEALKLCEEILPIGRRVLGPEHPYTLSTMVSLGYEYSKQGMPVKGQKLCEEILPISRRALGPEHPHTLEAIRDLESIQRELESMDTGRGSSTNPAP